MIAVDKKYSTVIYSLGKTGTSSLVKSIKDDWYTAGEENITWFKSKHSSDIGRHIPQKDVLDMCIHDYDMHPIFVIRDPWKRFVSGFKEIMQDYISVLHPNHSDFLPLWVDLINNEEQLTQFIDRLFYLGQVPTNKQHREQYKYDWGRTFCLFHNYHTANWLDITKQYPQCTILLSSQLDDFVTELGYTVHRENVSSVHHIKRIEHALLNCEHYKHIERMLDSEIAVYNEITG